MKSIKVGKWESELGAFTRGWKRNPLYWYATATVYKTSGSITPWEVRIYVPLPRSLTIIGRALSQIDAKRAATRAVRIWAESEGYEVKP